MIYKKKKMQTKYGFDAHEIILKIIYDTGGKVEKQDLIDMFNEEYKIYVVKKSLERLIKNNKLERINNRIIFK